MAKRPNSEERLDGYVVINGKRLNIKQHPTDFSVLSAADDLQHEVAGLGMESASLASRMTRITAPNKRARDSGMADIRKRNVAHHIYEVEDTGEELIVDDHIFLQLESPDPRELQEIIDQFNLVDDGRMGDTYVLRVTNLTGENPIKTANKIAKRDAVKSCAPQLMVPLQKHRTIADNHVLFREQWYLTADLINNPNVDPRADIQVPEAWQISTGDPSIVIAVQDDGFDLGHPAFRNKGIHPEARDFAANDRDPSPGTRDFHGTPVASIATGSRAGEAMVGVAPDCTLLPIRIGFGPLNQIQTLKEFRFASQHADIVNCSFGFPPLSFDIFDSGFRQEITQMTRTGGRRGKGLIIIFSAGNDDAPLRLRAQDNQNGVRFLGQTAAGNLVVRQIPAGNDVFCAYPSIEGVIVVAAMSSMLRKSGYSNWGDLVTVTAPSSNGHELGSLRDFSANYRGLGQIGASNRPGHGRSSNPLRDNPATPNVREHFYTDEFGGTSGAAPVVAGITGLMLSVNPDLTADEVRNILVATADKDLDISTDLPNDPNLQGMTGDFVGGSSLFFGGGKANAFGAVNRARALAGEDTISGLRVGSARPDLEIPDNVPQGVVSHIEIPGPGPITNITVEVDISHTYRGDLKVTLVSPHGFSANLHQVHQGGSADDLNRTYTVSNTPELRAWVDGGIEGGGRWSLHVSDNLRRDVGRFNAWGIDLNPASS